MDYYNTMRTDYIHKAMYPEDPMRIDFIPKGPPEGTLYIKPKDRCAPKIITKIEGAAVEEGCKVFFECIVDAKPQPKFSWYFNDEQIFPGKVGWEDAEVHDSRRMSTLILKYAREHHMGKYTVVCSNQLGTAECACDLIVRKKQFPPVFWQRLYNVGDEGSRRFVGGVEVGGWPVPAVFWYKVAEDGTETEVTSKTHTENWNGNPNKYVPSSRVEVRQIDDIRHCIVFHEVSSGDSGMYRVRAINCLGEAECEAELNFEECGEAGGGGEMYLPPLWREKRRLTWRDQDLYDQRKKPFVNVNEPSLTPEELAEMKLKSGVVPLSRITEYFATLPDYQPTDRFRDLERMPYKPGVDEQDYRAERKGGKVGCFPGKFERGNIVHYGYNTDAMGRILPWWYNASDPRACDSSDWRWKSVHPDLYIPAVPPRSDSPTPTVVWETSEDILSLVAMLRGMGCRMDEGKTVDSTKKTSMTYKEQQQQKASMTQQQTSMTQQQQASMNQQQQTSMTQQQQSTMTHQQKSSVTQASSESRSFINEKSEWSENSHQIQEQKQELVQGSKVKKFSYTGGAKEAEEYSKSVSTEQVTKAKNTQKHWQEKLEMNVNGQQTNAVDFTAQFLSTQELSNQHSLIGNTAKMSALVESSSQQLSSGQIYQKHDNLSFPELEHMSTQPPPALPPKTKIRNSPSRNIFSPTESLEGAGTASVKSVEFLPVKEKVKLIAAQQEELLRKEERSTKTSGESHKSKGVRILPPSPVTIRKMSVEEELHHYDSVVTRSTPTTGFMETPPPRPELPDMPMYQESRQSQGQTSRETTDDYSSLDSGFSHSVASFQQQSSSQQSHQVSSQSQQSSSLQSNQVSSSQSQEQASFSSSSQMVTSESQEVASSSLAEQMYSSTASYSTQKSSRAQVPGWSSSPALEDQSKKEELIKFLALEEQKQKEVLLTNIESRHGVDTSLDQLVSNDALMFHQQEQRSEVMQSSSSLTSQLTSLAMATDSFSSSVQEARPQESPAEECRRSFEEAELEAMALETQSTASLSKQSSIVESASVQSFTYQREEKSSETSFQNRGPLKSASAAFVRTPETFTHAQPPSSPTTPMSQRRRLRINQSPKPPADQDQESRPKYREGTASPFQPGFYRPPPEETTSSNPIFKLIRRNNSRTNLAPKETEDPSNQPPIRVSQASLSSRAYEGDSES